MARQAKYLYWTLDDFGFMTTQFLSDETNLKVEILLGPPGEANHKPIILVHNDYDWRQNIFDYIPMNILTGTVDKRYLKHLKVSKKDLKEVSNFVLKHQKFLLYVYTSDLVVFSEDMSKYFKEHIND